MNKNELTAKLNPSASVLAIAEAMGVEFNEGTSVPLNLTLNIQGTIKTGESKTTYAQTCKALGISDLCLALAMMGIARETAIEKIKAVALGEAENVKDATKELALALESDFRGAFTQSTQGTKKAPRTGKVTVSTVNA